MGGTNRRDYKRGKSLQGLVTLIVVFLVGVAMMTLIGFRPKIGTNYTFSPTFGSARVVIESLSKRIIKGGNYHARLPMASTTKVMTAYLACISGKLDNVVKVTRQSCGIEGSSLYLVEGEEIALRDLTYGLMLQSGNDCAETIALYLGNSIEGFAKLMNDKAAELNCQNTHFVNPHGLHDDEHYTSAYDLAVITANALINPDFREIVGTKSRVVNSSAKPPRYVANKNKMLNMYSGAIGVKTGYTKVAGRCLVSAASREGVEVVSVVLNAPDMWNESAYLLDCGFKACKRVEFVHKDIEILKVKLGKSKTVVPIACAEDYARIMFDGDNIDLTRELEIDKNIVLPLRKGDIIGKVKFFDGKRLLFESKIYTMLDVI